jgi:hypothetical protein
VDSESVSVDEEFIARYEGRDKVEFQKDQIQGKGSVVVILELSRTG